MGWATSTLRASDGVELRRYAGGRTGAPVILLVHGYPDDHTIWNTVAQQLAGRFELLAYDVRGSGGSSAPPDRAGYGIDQLADDLDAVAATAGRPVHVVGHDWGSVQAWHAVTRAGATQRYASFTSVSGPGLAYTGAWYRAAVRTGDARTPARAVLRQAAASWYVLFFLVPVLPERLWRLGLLQRLPALRRRAPAAPVDSRTAVNALELYRANVRASVRPRPCRILTQVLMPAHDPFITAACAAGSPRRWVPDLRVETIEGGHWTFVSRPERVSEPVSNFVEAVTVAGISGDVRPETAGLEH